MIQEGGGSIIQRIFRSLHLPEYNGNVRKILIQLVGRIWIQQEYDIILSDYADFGPAYVLISTHLIVRSQIEVQNRSKYLTRRRLAIEQLLL